jgi:hypothetical protein
MQLAHDAVGLYIYTDMEPVDAGLPGFGREDRSSYVLPAF